MKGGCAFRLVAKKELTDLTERKGKTKNRSVEGGAKKNKSPGGRSAVVAGEFTSGHQVRGTRREVEGTDHPGCREGLQKWPRVHILFDAGG